MAASQGPEPVSDPGGSRFAGLNRLLRPMEVEKANAFEVGTNQQIDVVALQSQLIDFVFHDDHTLGTDTEKAGRLALGVVLPGFFAVAVAAQDILQDTLD